MDFGHVVGEVLAPNTEILGLTGELAQAVRFPVHVLGIAHVLTHQEVGRHLRETSDIRSGVAKRRISVTCLEVGIPSRW